MQISERSPQYPSGYCGDFLYRKGGYVCYFLHMPEGDSAVSVEFCDSSGYIFLKPLDKDKENDNDAFFRRKHFLKKAFSFRNPSLTKVEICMYGERWKEWQSFILLKKCIHFRMHLFYWVKPIMTIISTLQRVPVF